jgi:hypothetical protein
MSIDAEIEGYTKADKNTTILAIKCNENPHV